VKVDNKFLDALAMVESGGRNVEGDSGRAVGPFQVWKIFCDETNRILGVGKGVAFNYSDRESYLASREMTKIVLSHWAGHHARKGVKVGYRELLSLHRHPNGAWKPENMDTELEERRWVRLKKYLSPRK